MAFLVAARFVNELFPALAGGIFALTTTTLTRDNIAGAATQKFFGQRGVFKLHLQG